ncbi:hypothetical protein BDQ17DRAFT_1238475 [Cyathus striatus]|nr:hypothetical protein BDQ17DRAFT_1238475 [Cyathus striatus]
MLFRHSLSRRDALLVLLGASSMQVWTLLFHATTDQSIIINTHLTQEKAADVEPPTEVTATLKEIVTTTQTYTVELEPTSTPFSTIPTSPVGELPYTTVVDHAPGWTVFRNLYMSNGTLYIVSPEEDHGNFPDIRMMTSTGLAAFNDAENIAAREPTKEHMDIITPEEAKHRWSGNVGAENHYENHVWTVEGNTLLFNDPKQFLNHYYHFVAELFFGVQAFWHGAWSKRISNPSTHFSLSHPSPPPFHRAIFVRSIANDWRDTPGFNSYFLRAAYPSLTVEHKEDWDDRIAITKFGDKAFHFPVVLFADRSAAHRGFICGSLTQRTAAEAWSYMKAQKRLMGMHVGGWWEPIRNSIWNFAGATIDLTPYTFSPPQDQKEIVITYINRQGGRRRLINADHNALVTALEEMVARRKANGEKWRLQVLRAEDMTKDEQVKAAAETTILLGVHGNGLTHLVFMQPTRVSTVIEIFYPEGFAHDYQWTTRALGMSHYAVWNDTLRTHPNKPDVNYPEGFQGESIPVHGPTVAQLIEDRVDGKL